MSAEGFAARGWAVFPYEAALEPWLAAARRRANQLLSNPQVMRSNLRHGRTWFVGVDVMGCDAQGAVPGGPEICGAGVAFAREQMSDNWNGDWGRGQLSVAFPGYPRRDPHETVPNHRFRKRRDGAHLDGLLPFGPARRRKFMEPHGVILGVALDGSDEGRSPLTVWEGSHILLLEMIRDGLGHAAPDQMSDIDLTEIYADTRKIIFDTHARVEVTVQPGEVIVLHRALLHGIAPWTSPSPHPRRVVYFRPELSSVAEWLA